MKKIGYGRQAEVFEDDRGLALKVFNSSVPLEYVKYEADISKKVAEVCTKAPRFYDIWHEGARYGLQLELIDGEILNSYISRHILHLRRYAREFGKLHREIHKNSVAGLPMASDKFGSRLRKYKDLDSNVQNRLLEFLNDPQAKALCHGDLHPENIMVAGDGELRAIDWPNAYCGDPLSDVARTYYLLTKGISPKKKTLFVRAVESMVRRVIAREYLRSYFSGRSFPKREFDMWMLIIQICRYTEGIKEEKAGLQKSIALGIKKLKFDLK